ncbi:MAG: CerR family C-terminal domain-containing protein [Phycisphaerales bacterium]
MTARTARTPPADDAADTRRRLLHAAGEVFAERGYRATTVREICRRANANIAAVNYHFRDKSTLYSEVLRYAHTCSIERHPPDLGTRTDDPPAPRLLAFVRSFLRRVLDEGRPAWHGRLMCREMAEPSPTAALDDLVRDNINVNFGRLEGIIRELDAGMRDPDPGRRQAPRRTDPEHIRLCAMSIVAQCLYFRFARPVLDRMFPGRYGPGEIDALAEHVVRTAVASLRAPRHGAPAHAPPRPTLRPERGAKPGPSRVRGLRRRGVRA